MHDAVDGRDIMMTRSSIPNSNLGLAGAVRVCVAATFSDRSLLGSTEKMCKQPESERRTECKQKEQEKEKKNGLNKWNA